ncbi:hypothetical protein [Ferrimonas marina]|uniref:Uncharacterized protein n=1 Tax=Ferrimonas marina TaxID=299255 RepID=A0A1M5UH13_9GAMM|nr:hypothetical protein [Ferrimonas marina]SHH62116.1 hypothetical protein SAMN02745129_2562 [Ferrimonas marina]
MHEQLQQDLQTLLDKYPKMAIQLSFAGTDTAGHIVLSSPDLGFTPTHQGMTRNPHFQGKEQDNDHYLKFEAALLHHKVALISAQCNQELRLVIDAEFEPGTFE